MFHRYTHPRLRMQWFVFVVVLGVFGLSMGAAKTAVAAPPALIAIIFNESMYDGTGGTSGNSIAVHESNNRFANDDLTMSGTGDMRTTEPSTGYFGASGTWNVFLTSTVGTYFQIADINTSNHTNLTLSFGVFKSTTAENGSSLTVAVSSDGTNWTNLTVPALPTGSGTAIWHYRTASGAIPTTTNLHIRFTNTSASPQFRIDDVILTGTPLTYDTINPDGDLGDWNSQSHKLGANNSDGTGLEYFLTWDVTYLYVAYAGGGVNDQYNVAIDIDPNDTGTDNSGTTNEYCGATFGADGKPDYVLQMAADNNVYGNQGSAGWIGWTPADSTAVKTGVPNQVEFRLSWSDLGLTDRNSPVGIYLWACNTGGELWASYPPTNPNQYVSGRTQPEYLSTRIYLPTTDAGRIPRFYAQHKGDQTQFDANGSFSLLNGFAQIEITNGGGNGCNFRVDVRGNAAADTNNSAVRRQYVIEPNGCEPTANMTLRYMDGDFAAPDERNGYADTNNLKLFRWNGSAWEDSGGTANDTANTVAVTGISAFSPWTFGTGSGPTAVSLSSFTAQTTPTLPLLLVFAGLMIGGTVWIKRK